MKFEYLSVGQTSFSGHHLRLHRTHKYGSLRKDPDRRSLDDIEEFVFGTCLRLKSSQSLLQCVIALDSHKNLGEKFTGKEKRAVVSKKDENDSDKETKENIARSVHRIRNST